VELKHHQDNYHDLKDEDELFTKPSLQEVIGESVEEAVEKGLIKPEQRTWAEVYATRDWQGFHEFLGLASRSLLVKKRMSWRIFPFSGFCSSER